MPTSASDPAVSPDMGLVVALQESGREGTNAVVEEPTLLGGRRPGTPQSTNVAPIAPSDGPSRDALRNSSTTPHDPSELPTSNFPAGAERYLVVAELGRGGCGVVQAAWDRQVAREVVVKRILPHLEDSQTNIQRFFNEARITGQLEHPGIAPVYEIGRDPSDGQPFYAMQRVHGQTLSQRLASLTPNEEALGSAPSQRQRHALLASFLQVCHTLAYAHGQGIIHRDLKPSNIVVGDFGRTIVLDWGLAKQVGDQPNRSVQPNHDPQIPGANTAESASGNVGSDNKPALAPLPPSESDDALTQQGTVMGTAAYMSPEQARGETSRIGFASDVFSLGTILYEILSGTSPFRSDSVPSTLAQVARAEYIPLRQLRRDIPRALCAICERALQYEPESRYSDAGELAHDLECFLAGDAVTAYPEAWWERLDRFANRHRGIVWASFLGLFLIALMAVIAGAVIQRANQAERAARHLAQLEADQKHVALQRESQAHGESLTQLHAARQAIDTWLIELSGDLQFYPGLQEIRQQLLSKAHAYYRDLSQSQAGSQPLELVRQQIRLGDICRLTGDLKQAQAHYQQARQTLGQHDSQQLDWRIQDVNIDIGLAMTSLDQSQTTPAVQESICRAVDKSKQILAQMPDWREAKSVFIRAGHAASRCWAANHRYDEAIATLREALSVAESHYLQQGTTSEFQLLVNLLHDQASYQRAVNDWESSRLTETRLVQLYSHQLQSRERPDWLESRAVTRLQASECDVRHLQLPSAVIELESAELDLHQAWNLQHRDTALRENLAIAQANLGHISLATGNYDHAEERFRTAIDALQALVRQSGADNDRIVRMAHCFLGLAMVPGLAESEREHLFKDLQPLVQHLQQQPGELAITGWRLGIERAVMLAEQAGRQAQPQSISEAYEQAALLLEQAAPSQAMSVDERRLAEGRLGVVRAQLLQLGGDQAGAQQTVRQAQQAWEYALPSLDARSSVSAAFYLMESLCESPYADALSRQRAQEIAAEFCSRFKQHAELWHWRACTAWHNGQYQEAWESLQTARTLRAACLPRGRDGQHDRSPSELADHLADRWLASLVLRDGGPSLVAQPSWPNETARNGTDLDIAHVERCSRFQPHLAWLRNQLAAHEPRH